MAREHRRRNRLFVACPAAKNFFEEVALHGGHLGGTTSRLLRLLDLYGAPALDIAIRDAHERNAFRAESVAHVLDQNRRAAARRSLERRLARSRLGRCKPMADYDWQWPTKIDRPLVESVLQLDFISSARNVVLVAPQGLGKTMIAQNLAHQAILAGHSVLFTTAAQMLLDLGRQDSSRALEQRLRHYAKTTLLVLDEVGYLAFDNRNADLLF